jgi:hypothetical protein
VSRRRAHMAPEQLPPPPPASETAPVPVATWTVKPLPPAEARAAWERLAAALRRAVSER